MTAPAPGAFSVMAETGTNEEVKVWSVHMEAAAEMVMVGSANTKRGLSGRGLGLQEWRSVSHKEYSRPGASVSLLGSPLTLPLSQSIWPWMEQSRHQSLCPDS